MDLELYYSGLNMDDEGRLEQTGKGFPKDLSHYIY